MKKERSVKFRGYTIGLMLGLAGLPLPCAPAQSLDEYQAKAAFLFNFAKFVEWPAGPSEKEPIRICVLGQSPFGGSLENLLRGRDIAGRPLSTLQVTDLQQAVNCQVIFVRA